MKKYQANNEKKTQYMNERNTFLKSGITKKQIINNILKIKTKIVDLLMFFLVDLI